MKRPRKTIKQNELTFRKHFSTVLRKFEKATKSKNNQPFATTSRKFRISTHDIFTKTSTKDRSKNSKRKGL